MMQKLIVYGTGTLARQVFLYNERYHLYDIIAFADDNPNRENEFLGKPVFSYEALRTKLKNIEDVLFLVTIGYVKCNDFREGVCHRLQKDDYRLTNFISPGSNCWPDTLMGLNVIVFDNVFVGVGCELGNGVIISEGSTLSHDIKVGEYTFFSDEVTVGGHAEIKNNCFLGLNSTIKSGSVIGSYNVVGSAANVIHSTDDFCVTIGNPGVSIKKDTRTVNI